MTVLYIIHQTLLMAGSAKSFLIMLQGLMQKGIHPVVVMPDKNGIYAEIVGMGVPTIVVPYRNNTYPWVHSFKDALLFFPRLVMRRVVIKLAVKKIVKEMAGTPIQLVHTNVGVCNIGFMVSRKLGVPHVYHIREYADKDHGMYFFPTRNSFLRQLTAPASYNICITKDIQRHFLQQDSSTSRVIYNGIQAAVETFPSLQQKEKFFLYAGRIVPIKGVLEMIKAYNAYKERTEDAHPLYLIGELADKVYYDRIMAYLQKHHLERYVTIFGEKPDVQNWMRRALAIIIPSPCEGFGRCMPEAMFCGCLAIGHHTGGTWEQLENGRIFTGDEIGLHYEEQEQLTELLLEVGKHPAEYYVPYLKRAFQTVNHFYTTESYVEKVYSFYEHIAHSHGLEKRSG
ncbi:MAG: glycosyltransferase family 4 protein [Bacteroidaceae bacterium]|nr:glycosyltransferase family 4 protein [Bacteroidaceae bacterium]